MFDEICKNAEKCDIQRFEWGEVAWLHEPDTLSNQRLSAGLVKFFPGKKQSQHIHFGEEQVLYVIEGQGIQILNGKKQDIREGMLIHCPPYSEHEVVNSGDFNLVFLIIYTPSKIMEVPQNIPLVKGRHLLDMMEPEVLENIQEEVSRMLGLSVIIMDSDFTNISENRPDNNFCRLCRDNGLCVEKNLSGRYESTLDKLDKVYTCCCNIMKIVVPVLIGDEIAGYLSCGCFIINKPENYEKLIGNELLKAGEDMLREWVEAYDHLPVLPKSRLYALQESLEGVSKIISGIIESNIVEKEINEKNTEILKNTKDRMDLEHALKQANLKLMKSKLTSALKSNNINLGSFLNKEEVEYPIGHEEKLSTCIRKLDMNSSEDEVTSLMDYYREKGLPINAVKDTFLELLMALSRIVYSETEKEDVFLNIRYKYREGLENCNDFISFEKLFLDFSQEIINILKDNLLKGKFSLIQKVNQYIKNNYNQDITLNFLSNMFYISPNYLSTMFNEKNGMTLKDYINKLRIEKAKEYLVETDLKISEISRKVGYSQLSYFGSVFKRLENCTPNEWRSRI